MAIVWGALAVLGVLGLFLSIVSVVFPLRFLGVKSRGQALKGLVASIVALIVAGMNLPPSTSSSRQDQPTPTLVSNEAPAVVEEPLPDAEKRLIAAVRAAADSYKGAQNDLAKGATRAVRARAICAAVRPGTVKDWVGKVATLSSNSDGKGVISVEIAPKIHVQTWNNALSDVLHETLIAGDSPVLAQAATLSKGMKVRFSGRFFASDVDCIHEQSMTLSGSMTSPDFVFRFSKIEPL